VAVALGVLLGCGPAAASPGFVAADGAQFSLGGRQWRPIGFDQYRLTALAGGYVCDAGYGAISDASLGQRLDDMKASGANVVRTWFFQSVYAEGGWAPFDRLLSAAASRGMTVIPVLVNHWPDCEPSGDEQKTIAFYATGFRDPGYGYAQSFEAYARMVAAHYASNRAIAFWQLVNEAETPAEPPAEPPLEPPPVVCGVGGAGALRAFASEMRDELRAVDPNHLVSLGTIGSGQCGASYLEYRSLHEVVDICEVHDYGAPQAALPGDPFNGIAFRISQCNALGKPIFVGEAGIPADVGEDGLSTGTTSAATLARRAQLFDAKMGAQLGAGMDGYLIWETIAESSDSAFAGLERFGVGRLGIGMSEDPVGAVMRARAGAPSPTIAAGPSGVTGDATPTFAFSSIAASATFECRVGTVGAPGTFAPCASPYTPAPLADGARVFEVRSATGDSTPARRPFVVDTGPPETVIVGVPSGFTNDPTPSFELLPDEPGGSLECAIGTMEAPGTLAPCRPSYTTPPLADGEHVLRARATDAVGAADATPATLAFTVDTVAPKTTIVGAPGAVTSDPTPTFRFSSDDPAASFRCRLDGGALAACASPYDPAALGDGSHVFEVRAVDRADNVDATPASASFRVELPAPPPPPPPPPPAPPPPPPPPPPVAPPPPAVALIGSGVPGAVRVGRDGRGSASRPRVRCPAAAPACRVSVELRAASSGGRSSRIGGSTSTIRQGADARVSFALSRAGRRLLARRRTLRATLRLSARHGDDVEARTMRVTLKRR